MKKFFSLIALVGVIAACTPEQIQTAFKLAGAKGTITVDVVTLDGTPFAGQYQISGQESLPGVTTSYSGNKATIEFQLADSQAVESVLNLTLSASGPEILKPGKAQVFVPKILAGGEASLACTIKVGENVDGWYLEEEYEYDETQGEVEIGFLANSHYEVYTHSAEYYYADYYVYWNTWADYYFKFEVPSWYINNSDLILSGKVDMPYVIGTETLGVELKNYEGFSHQMKAFVDDWAEYLEEWAMFGDYEEGTIPFEFQVSAWAMWNVVDIHYAHPTTATLLAYELDDDNNFVDEDHPLVLGVASCKEHYVTGGAIEEPYPGMPGHAHYEEGHGHGHGGDNAGGGISYNE